MGLIRRVIPQAVIFSLLLSSIPTRSLAVTTQQEIRAGQAEDEQITSSQVVETDPLINAYAQAIANKLWLQVARKDLPYNLKVIKASDINSFATEGGFVYIDEGLIDFVQSDDEFAGVIGHETGHIERRHVITLNTKSEIISILAALASIFSPFLMPASNLLGEAMIMKASREDEIQADRYGLQLMSRAGYDPSAMVTMMQHMGVLAEDQSELVDKYLEDHPEPQARVARLVGYPELDPKVVTSQELLVRADSDAERARYSIAAIKLRDILQHDPSNAEALLKLSQCQIALGLLNRSQETLAEAARLGSPAMQALVAERQRELRELEQHEVSLLNLDPDYNKLSADIADAQRALNDVAAAMRSRQDDAHEQLQSYEVRLQDVAQDVPQIDGQPQANSRMAAVLEELGAISRAANSAFDDTSQVIDNIGSLDPMKNGGLMLEEHEVLNQMAAPLSLRPLPEDALALLPSYPRMLREISSSQENLARSLDTARTALATMGHGIDELDETLRDLGNVYSGSGDVGGADYNNLAPQMNRLLNEFNEAAITASQAAQLYNMARARALSVQITLLGLSDSPQRYATLQYALQQRFGMDGVDYSTMLHDGITPGDVTAATILAADTQSTPQAIIEESLRTGTPIIDLANEHGMHAWPLEIFMRLVYLDYTDDPVREMRTGAPAGAAGED